MSSSWIVGLVGAFPGDSLPSVIPVGDQTSFTSLFRYLGVLFRGYLLCQLLFTVLLFYFIGHVLDNKSKYKNNDQ